MELKGSKTEANLMEAFAGESQARNKYTYYASQAKKDGYVQITMKKNTQKSGLNYYTAVQSEIPLITLKTQPKVKTMNGQICMQDLQKKPEKKGLMT